MTVAVLAGQFRDHLAKCAEGDAARAKAFSELKDAVTGKGGLKEAVDKYEAIVAGVRKLVMAVATTVVGGLILLGAENFLLHKQAAATTVTTAAQVAKYTAADAARDRSAQEQRDQAIMDKLDSLGPGTR